MVIDLDLVLGQYKPYYDANVPFKHVARNILEVAIVSDRQGDEELRDKMLGIFERYKILLQEFPDIRKRDLEGHLLGIHSLASKYVTEQWLLLKGEKLPY